MTWFEEDLHTSTRQLIREDRLLFHGWTRYQEVRIFENDLLGKVLALDRVVQTTEADEFFYHEMMAHVPLVSHGAVEKVLVVGGADGGVLREVLRHPVSKVTIVDIDGELIDICRRHLPALSAGAFDDPRVEVIAADGAKYVSETDQLFDTIIIDSTDPVGPATALFSEAFLIACRDRMSSRSLLVRQNGVPFLQPKQYIDGHRMLSSVFENSGSYFTIVPTYQGGYLSIGWAAIGMTDLDPRQSPGRDRSLGVAETTRYYRTGIHLASLIEPPCFGQKLRSVNDPERLAQEESSDFSRRVSSMDNELMGASERSR